MDIAELKSELSHSSFVTAGGTVTAYLVILLSMTVLLFGIPYLLFTLF